MRFSVLLELYPLHKIYQRRLLRISDPFPFWGIVLPYRATIELIYIPESVSRCPCRTINRIEMVHGQSLEARIPQPVDLAPSFMGFVYEPRI